MKLTVRFGDHSNCCLAVMHTGITPPVKYRMVTIELTEDQAEQLKYQQIGWDSGAALWETREVIALED